MNIDETLAVLKLNEKEREIYQLLAKSGWSTVLSLARKCSIKRTSIYNILDGLIEKGFVDIKIDDSTTYYNIADTKNIQLAIKQEKDKIDKMQEALNTLNSNLPLLSIGDKSKTSVHFYRGVSGVESVEWKMASVKDSVTLIIATTEWRDVTGREFSETMRQRRVENNASIRELMNPEKYNIIPDDLNLPYTNNKEYIKNLYAHREISKEIFDITNEVIIFNDSTYFYSFDQTDIVVIEIISKGYANMFRNLFELAWDKAKIKDKFGN